MKCQTCKYTNTTKKHIYTNICTKCILSWAIKQPPANSFYEKKKQFAKTIANLHINVLTLSQSLLLYRFSSMPNKLKKSSTHTGVLWSMQNRKENTGMRLRASERKSDSPRNKFVDVHMCIGNRRYNGSIHWIQNQIESMKCINYAMQPPTSMITQT